MMNSQINNNNDNQEQMISEDQFRTVFFDSGKRACQSTSELNKRARLDVPTVPSPPVSTATSPNASESGSASKNIITSASATTQSAVQGGSLSADIQKSSACFSRKNSDAAVAAVAAAVAATAVSAAHKKSSVATATATGSSTGSSTAIKNNTTAALTADKITKATTAQHRDLARDPASRFSVGSASRPVRSRSLPNLAFNHHRRYRSQPLAALNNISFSTTFNPIATQQQAEVSSISSAASTAASSTATARTTNSKDKQACVKLSSKPSKRSHRHRLHNLSFNGSDSSPVLLPPVNTQSLREIDLQEILKNPQLRHDILFDPQLQFRPNLDGERGRRKKQIVDKYWGEVEEECKEYMKLSNKVLANSGDIALSANVSKFHLKYSKLPRLFSTLRDILITLLPSKDRPAVYDVMDVDLLVQQLRRGVVDFVALAKWLANVFKSHCAPMRDPWVDEMTEKFVEADKENSIKKLIDGLRTIFNILEAMKLDVANHQIRVLRPALVETAVDFERDYFSQMISRRNLNIQDSLVWYCTAYENQLKKDVTATAPNFLRNVSVSAIIKLLSCREMASEFPSSLSFDHPRLILLRADVRQLVCLQICLYLYKQLVSTYNKDSAKKSKLLAKNVLNDVKREILAVITDENGNVKWTRNIPSIAVQLAKRASMDLSAPQAPASSAPPPALIVSFAHSWLLKQTQPRSDVYGLMEERIFTQLRTQVVALLDNNKSGSAIQASQVPKAATGNGLSSSSAPTPTSAIPASAFAAASGASTPSTPTSASSGSGSAGASGAGSQLSEEISSLATRLFILSNFHWSVFGTHYTEAVKDTPINE